MGQRASGDGGKETDGATIDPFSRDDLWVASLRAKKGHVASRAPFATNVPSSGLPFDGAVPGRTLDESFTSSTRAASLEGSTTAVATVRAPSECRSARPDETRTGVLIPESARARPRGSPRLCAREREKAAAGTRTPYVSVEVIVWRWGRALRSAKVQRATDGNQSASLGNYPTFEAAKNERSRAFSRRLAMRGKVVCARSLGLSLEKKNFEFSKASASKVQIVVPVHLVASG